MDADGDFTRKDYLRTAEDAYRFLDAHNKELINDGVENIVDDYCALLAATELYRASHDETWRVAADRRAASLMARLTTHDGQQDYWRADAGTRPSSILPMQVCRWLRCWNTRRWLRRPSKRQCAMRCTVRSPTNCVLQTTSITRLGMRAS